MGGSGRLGGGVECGWLVRRVTYNGLRRVYFLRSYTGQSLDSPQVLFHIRFFLLPGLVDSTSTYQPWVKLPCPIYTACSTCRLLCQPYLLLNADRIMKLIMCMLAIFVSGVHIHHDSNTTVLHHYTLPCLVCMPVGGCQFSCHA